MFNKLSKHPLLTGSFLLTCTGFISRIIGFYYRIYLSKTFGEEGMGIYQLLTPVLALSFSLTAAGFQTAISKFVAEQTGKTRPSGSALKPLRMGISISLPLSVLVTLFIIYTSENIAFLWLNEPRTAPMLRILSLSIPLSTLHACINGYFYGLKKAVVPAIAQIIEQIFRVVGVFTCSAYFFAKNQIPPLSITVLGLFIGELVSTVVASVFWYMDYHKIHNTTTQVQQTITITYSHMFSMVIPLIANRVTLNALQSIETISLPAKLKLYGYDHATALSVYGVLTGMAFPLIFFPNAVTGSIAVLLLPLISEESACGNTKEVRSLTTKAIQYCSYLGFICMALFLLFGNHLGILLFNSKLAGIFISGLSFICPFIYLNSTLSAILQGLGKVMTLFFINVVALLIRLLFIFNFVPSLGIQGYLWGLLIGQIFTTTFYLASIVKTKKAHPRG